MPAPAPHKDAAAAGNTIQLPSPSQAQAQRAAYFAPPSVIAAITPSNSSAHPASSGNTNTDNSSGGGGSNGSSSASSVGGNITVMFDSYGQLPPSARYQSMPAFNVAKFMRSQSNNSTNNSSSGSNSGVGYLHVVSPSTYTPGMAAGNNRVPGNGGGLGSDGSGTYTDLSGAYMSDNETTEVSHSYLYNTYNHYNNNNNNNNNNNSSSSSSVGGGITVGGIAYDPLSPAGDISGPPGSHSNANSGHNGGNNGGNNSVSGAPVLTLEDRQALAIATATPPSLRSQPQIALLAAFLRSLPFFATFPAELCTALTMACSIRRYEAREIVMGPQQATVGSVGTTGSSNNNNKVTVSTSSSSSASAADEDADENAVVSENSGDLLVLLWGGVGSAHVASNDPILLSKQHQKQQQQQQGQQEQQQQQQQTSNDPRQSKFGNKAKFDAIAAAVAANNRGSLIAGLPASVTAALARSPVVAAAAAGADAASAAHGHPPAHGHSQGGQGKNEGTVLPPVRGAAATNSISASALKTVGSTDSLASNDSNNSSAAAAAIAPGSTMRYISDQH